MIWWEVMGMGKGWEMERGRGDGVERVVGRVFLTDGMRKPNGAIFPGSDDVISRQVTRNGRIMSS